jgi:hypothetical protein
MNGHIGTAKNDNNPPKVGTSVKKPKDYQQIIKLIDEMIEEVLEYAHNDYNNGYWASLTELKEKIKEVEK